jgi:hypothetical protein
MDAPIERRLETLANAADKDRIADEVERLGLLDLIGHVAAPLKRAALRRM